MAVDLFHSHADDVCSICHEELSSGPTYTLPECQHAFHTHCIVTWFRHSSASSVSQGEDAPCPYCMNRGINNGLEALPCSDSYDLYRHRLALVGPRERLLKAFISKPGRTSEPMQAEIRNVLDSLKKARQRFKEKRGAFTRLKRSLKDDPVPYNEANAKVRAGRRSIWGAGREVREKGMALLAIPIAPLIIPTPVDIN